jgi:Lipase
VRAAANSRLVGKQLAFLLKGLNKNNGLEFSKVHIIGFSLGAHASGELEESLIGSGVPTDMERDWLWSANPSMDLETWSELN